MLVYNFSKPITVDFIEILMRDLGVDPTDVREELVRPDPREPFEAQAEALVSLLGGDSCVVVVPRRISPDLFGFLHYFLNCLEERQADFRVCAAMKEKK